MNSKTDVAALAREVVDKCDLIHKSQLSDVEQIIYYLKKRKDPGDSGVSSLKSATVRSKSEARPVDRGDADKASIRNIDEYIELLYEELPERIRGSAFILQLARNPDNLEELEKNEAVLSALSRVLREDWRKSLDLSTNIIYTFFCFSTYTHFHSVIVQYKIGSLCMDVIEHELKRYEQMKQDLDKRKNADSGKNDVNKSQDNLDGTIMNVEKPKDVKQYFLIFHQELDRGFVFLDGTTKKTNSRIKAASKKWQLVNGKQYDIISFIIISPESLFNE